jgi:hypothetical protein
MSHLGSIEPLALTGRLWNAIVEGMRVSKAVIVGVVVAFAAAIAAIAFLLGRESGRRQDVAVAAVVPQAAQAEAPQPKPKPNPSPEPNLSPEPNPLPLPNPSLNPPPSSSPPPPSPAGLSAESLAVRDYFARLAAVQASGLAGDPTEVANKLLAATMAGDSSGFDDIINAAQRGEDKARALSVPPACAAYHARTLALLHDGVTLTRSLRVAIERQDTTALTSLAASASSLQSRVDGLKEEERILKTRFGLPQ